LSQIILALAVGKPLKTDFIDSIVPGNFVVSGLIETTKYEQNTTAGWFRPAKVERF
jgi:hypothetical protein